MTKKILDAHPSVTIAYCPTLEKFLFSCYDEGYPKVAYRLSANLLGGNPEGSDAGPENLIIKELSEEVDPNHPEEKKKVGKVIWAPKNLIRMVRNSILSGITPYQDFYVEVGEVPGGVKPHNAIFSVFYTEVSADIVSGIAEAIQKNEHITTEGLLKDLSYENLKNSPKGEFATAHATAPILNYKFGFELRFPSAVHAEAIGAPRRSYNDYLSDFEYNNENLKLAARAKL